jgi:hypothetical protein
MVPASERVKTVHVSKDLTDSIFRVEKRISTNVSIESDIYIFMLERYCHF